MHEYHYELTNSTKKHKKLIAKLVLYFFGRAPEACTVLDENVIGDSSLFSEKLYINKRRELSPTIKDRRLERDEIYDNWKRRMCIIA